jgi:hypothetical protein
MNSVATRWEDRGVTLPNEGGRRLEVGLRGPAKDELPGHMGRL